jgi:epoxide hydrolase-like predicted phosphatase
MIKTILFDIGGVITHTDFNAIYSNFALRIGLKPQVVIQYHKQHMDDLLLGKITIEQFWQDMKNSGGNSSLDFKNIWIDEGIKNREIDNELLEIIRELRKKYSVGTLTNLTESRFIIDEQANLYSNFDYEVLSCKEHLQKPDPDFYHLALAKTSARPEEAIFIDDKEKCVQAANALGINGIIYINNSQLLEDLKNLGVDIDYSLLKVSKLAKLKSD